MKGDIDMPQIIPIKELKNTSAVSEMCHNTDEPVFITKNGYGDMVIMSIETYEQRMNREKMYRELEISERQISEGKVMDAQESIARLKAKYGI